MNQNLNIAGKLSLIFINHPLTFFFGVFILALGYISLLIMPREENPQIKVSGGVEIVALPGVKPSEIQKVIIEPLDKKIKEILITPTLFGKDNTCRHTWQIKHHKNNKRNRRSKRNLLLKRSYQALITLIYL